MTAIGTGGKRYAKAFIEDEQVPFPVLLDEDGIAAEIAGTKTLSAGSLLGALILSELGGAAFKLAAFNPATLAASL